MFRIFGLPNDTPTDFSTFLNRVHPNDRAMILDTEQKILSGAPILDAEFRIIRPDGETRFVRSIVEIIKNDGGIPVRFAGAVQATTEQVKARESLRESEERLTDAERIAHLGHWDWDIKTNRVSWSEEMFRIAGRPQNYTPSYEEFFEIVSPQDRDRAEQWIRDCVMRHDLSPLDSHDILRCVRHIPV